MSPSENSNDTRGLGRGMLIAFWLLVIVVLTWTFGNFEKHSFNPNQSIEGRVNQNFREVVLESNRQHHYVADGRINNQRVTFLLDTGATDVVVPAQLANRLGLQRGPSSLASTANGAVRVYSTLIDTLQLGNIRLHNVRASINPGMNGNEVLMGMSALRSIEFYQRDGRLVLRQPVISTNY